MEEHGDTIERGDLTSVSSRSRTSAPIIEHPEQPGVPAYKVSACREKIAETLKKCRFRLENTTASDILQRVVIDPLKECQTTFQYGQMCSRTLPGSLESSHCVLTGLEVTSK